MVWLSKGEKNEDTFIRFDGMPILIKFYFLYTVGHKKAPLDIRS